MSKNKAWIGLFIGGLLEVVWASGLKFTTIPRGVVIICLILSFYLLMKSMKVLPVGTVYAIFTSMGTIGTVIVDSVYSPEPFPISKWGLILLLLICVIGLKLANEEGAK